MRHFRFAIALLLMSSIGVSGDTLILKDGQKIDGRYLSSDAGHVQFEVDGKTSLTRSGSSGNFGFRVLHPGAAKSGLPDFKLNNKRKRSARF